MAEPHGTYRQLLVALTCHHRFGVEPQKKSIRASERKEEARALWWQAVIKLDPARLVFVDESGSHLAMTPAYARAPKGMRATASLPKNRGKNTTIIGALSLSGWQVTMTLEGAADTAAFEVFVEHFLCPTLEPGQIVVLDNLSIHKSGRVRQLLEEAGCSLLFLPTYSPDLNPIELAWSKLKTYLRRSGARTRELLEVAGVVPTGVVAAVVKLMVGIAVSLTSLNHETALAILPTLSVAEARR